MGTRGRMGITYDNVDGDGDMATTPTTHKGMMLGKTRGRGGMGTTTTQTGMGTTTTTGKMIMGNTGGEGGAGNNAT